MSLTNGMRRNCRDVFNSFLVRFAEFAGLFEFPIIKLTNCIPNRLIPFSRAISSKDYNQWVHFYEDDYLFEKLCKRQTVRLTLKVNLEDTRKTNKTSSFSGGL